MSAAAINPAPTPAPGAASATGANGNASAAQSNSPLGAFEAILSALFGAEGLGAEATADGNPGTKVAGDGKPASGEGKAKTKDDGDTDAKSAAVDAGATVPTADVNLALQIPNVPALPVAAAPPAATEGLAAKASPQSAVAGVADKAAGQTAAGVLAQLAGADAQPKGAKASAELPAANPLADAAPAAATDAAATIKIVPPLQEKPDGSVAAPQPDAPQPPAVQPPGLAVATAAVAASPAADIATPGGGKDIEPKDAGPKDKTTPTRTGPRVDLAKADGAPAAASNLTAKAVDPLQSAGSEGPSKGGPADKEPGVRAEDVSKADSAPGQQGSAAAPAATAASLIHASAVAVRAAPQTVASLAAQIVKKLDGRATQFDIQLDPAGLGKVDVRVAIGADGRMSAAMSFDTPQAAAELRSRAAELQRALEQSGFDLSGGMSFDVASDRGQGGQAQNQQADAGATFRGRAFQAALDTSADVAPPQQLSLRRTALAGVDIRI